MTSIRDAIVLVTPRSFLRAGDEVRAELEDAVGEVRYTDRGRPLTSEELRSELGDVDGMIAGVDQLDAAAFESAPRLRVVARYGVGVDTVDLEAAAHAGVVVTNTPGANAVAVAELTVALILALARRVPLARDRVRAGEWAPLVGREIRGRTVGLLGLGSVGAAVAERLRVFGCAVIAHDPVRDPEFARRLGAELVALGELFERADVLSLHVPVTDETRDIVDARLLGELPRGALLVNTARGELVVEADLVAALESGRLAGAALDVLREEPPRPGHPLLRRDDVIVTPHIGGHTEEATEAMARTAVAELLAVLSGGKPRHPVGVGEEASR
jgi:D-3-phosphoglycerate dehydrogenase